MRVKVPHVARRFLSHFSIISSEDEELADLVLFRLLCKLNRLVIRAIIAKHGGTDGT
jgi:hypothetical protein